MNEDLKQTLALLRARHYPLVPGIPADQAQRLYHLAKAFSPEGVYSDKFVPMRIESNDWEVRYFTDRGYGSDVEFRLFYPGRNYCSLCFIVHSDGRVEQSSGGYVPTSDVRPNEPVLPEVKLLVSYVSEAIRQCIAI